MENNETIEQRIKLSYETNADETADKVKELSDNMDNVDDAAKRNEDTMKDLDATQKSFKTQLKEANAELRKAVQLYGETADETVKAAKKVADLKDQMQFTKDLTNRFDPDQKMKALGAATQLASTGVQGLTAGFALFGDQSADTQKTLLKVQAAMAFSDSISNLSTLGDKWKIFKTVTLDTYKAIFAAKQRELVLTEEQTAAQVIQNLVARANPYILLATVIAAVTIATVAWIKSSKDQAEQLKLIGDAISMNTIKTDALKESMKEYNNEFNSGNEIDVLRAKSLKQTDAQVQKLIKSQNELAVSNAIDKEAEAYKNLQEAATNLGDAYENGDDKLIQSAQKAKDSAESYWREATQARTDAINKGIKDELQGVIDKNKKLDDIRKAEMERLKQAREKEKTALEAFEKEQYNIRQNWLKLKNDQEKAFLDEIDAAKKAIRDRQIGDTDAAIEAENERYAKQLETAKEFNKSTEDLELEHWNKINDIKLGKQKEAQEQFEAVENAKLAFKESITQAEWDLAEKASQFLSAIAGKNKTLQRIAILAESGVSIAKMISQTAASNVAAQAAGAALALPTHGASVIAAQGLVATNQVSLGLGIGSTIAATAKALQALGGGGAGSSGGSGSTTTPGGSSGSAAPQVNFQASSENQIGNSVGRQVNEQQPIRAFVVASEISTAQQLEANQISSNSI